LGRSKKKTYTASAQPVRSINQSIASQSFATVSTGSGIARQLTRFGSSTATLARRKMPKPVRADEVFRALHKGLT